MTDSHVICRSPKSSLVPSPVYHEGRLYCPGGTVQCLDPATGKAVYAGRLTGGGTSFSASPLAADGNVYYVTRTAGTYVIQAGPEFKQLAFNKFEDDSSRSNACPIAHDDCILLRTDKYLSTWRSLRLPSRLRAQTARPGWRSALSRITKAKRSRPAAAPAALTFSALPDRWTAFRYRRAAFSVGCLSLNGGVSSAPG